MRNKRNTRRGRDKRWLEIPGGFRFLRGTDLYVRPSGTGWWYLQSKYARPPIWYYKTRAEAMRGACRLQRFCGIKCKWSLAA